MMICKTQRVVNLMTDSRETNLHKMCLIKRITTEKRKRLMEKKLPNNTSTVNLSQNRNSSQNNPLLLPNLMSKINTLMKNARLMMKTTRDTENRFKIGTNSLPRITHLSPPCIIQGRALFPFRICKTFSKAKAMKLSHSDAN